MKEVQYRAPNGLLIVGSADIVSCTANLQGFHVDDNGTLEPSWSGDTTIHWDSQYTKCDNGGQHWYVDEEGNEWTLDQCTQEATVETE